MYAATIRYTYSSNGSILQEIQFNKLPVSQQIGPLCGSVCKTTIPAGVSCAAKSSLHLCPAFICTPIYLLIDCICCTWRESPTPYECFPATKSLWKHSCKGTLMPDENNNSALLKAKYGVCTTR